jgi:putative pyruvate formate lyase activating enzyme
MQIASYLQLQHRSELTGRIKEAQALLKECSLCPHHCGINRSAGEVGKCQTSARAIVYGYGVHMGEEAPIVGKRGSGAIFFSGCNLKCVFCQNYYISQLGKGKETNAEELARIMLTLQDKGCHNINLVTPTHVVPQILEALEIATGKGLHLPLVYNSGGYDSITTLKLLENIIDIYLPDMKYGEAETAKQLSGIDSYPAINKDAVREMYRQVGDLQMNREGIAKHGLLVRHLVLPHNLAGTGEITTFLANEISPNTYVNIMAQYYPCHMAHKTPDLARPITATEFQEAMALARQAGLNRLEKNRTYPIIAGI